MEKKGSVGKPPLHPDGRGGFNRLSSVDQLFWIADGLRTDSEVVKFKAKAFAMEVKDWFKLRGEWSRRFIIELAFLVVSKVESTPLNKRHKYDDRGSVPFDSPCFLLFLSANTFAQAVLYACNIKSDWWPDAFSPYLISLLKKMLRSSANKLDAVPANKLKPSPPPKPVDVVAIDASLSKKLKASPPPPVDGVDGRPSKKLKGPIAITTS